MYIQVPRYKENNDTLAGKNELVQLLLPVKHKNYPKTILDIDIPTITYT